MKKRIAALVLACAVGASFLAGCGEKKTEDKKQPSVTEDVNAQGDVLGKTEVKLFAAASLKTVMEELITVYNETQPNVKIVGSYDSSGTLLTQIEEGAACDIFFSAAQKQMNTLQEEDNLVVEGTRYNVLNNQLCVVTYKGSDTKVTGLSDLKQAANLALADGSVPVGKYTRQAMVAAKMLPEAEDVSKITTKAVSYTHLVFFFDQFLKTTYANKLVYTLFACMVTGWLAILCVNLGLGTHLDKIMMGDVMLFIPTLALCNSLKDMLHGDILTGVYRSIEAMLIASAIAGGFFVANVTLGGGYVNVVESLGPKPSIWVQTVTAVVGSVGFSVFFHIQRKKIWTAAVGGAVAWGTYLLASQFVENLFLVNALAAIAVCF